MKKRGGRYRRKTRSKGISHWLVRSGCELLVDIWLKPLIWIFRKFRVKKRNPRKSGIPINEKHRLLHTYITGGTGSGKSENIKSLVHHYLTDDTSASVVVIDPHGQLARQIARYKENIGNDRLVYVKPDLKEGYAPTINPLELDDLSPNAITVQTEEVISVFRELIDKGENADKFTSKMEVLLYPCLYTLIQMKDRTLLDLLDFMDPERAKPFIEYALKNCSNPAHIDFFKRIYHDKSYNQTRLSISTRLQSIFNSLPTAHFLIGQSSVDLATLVEQRSLVVFDLGDLGDLSRETIGRFVVASLQSYARRRKPGSTTLHLFLDEAHNFVSPSLGKIMKEARKFGLHATLAQQIYGEGMTPQMREIINGNTAVKITARNSDKSLRAYAANTGADLVLLKSLKKHEYVIQSSDNEAKAYKLNSKTIGNRNAMSVAAWQAVLNKQIQEYYRISR